MCGEVAAGASLGASRALGGAASCPGSRLDWPAVHRPRRPHLPACVPLHPPASGGGLVSLDGRQHTPSLQLSTSHVHFSLVGAAGHSPPRRGDHAGCLLSTATFGHSWSFRLPSHGAWARPARASAPGHELYVWAPPHAPSGVGQRFGVGTGAGGQPPASRSRVPPPRTPRHSRAPREAAQKWPTSRPSLVPSIWFPGLWQVRGLTVPAGVGCPLTSAQ